MRSSKRLKASIAVFLVTAAFLAVYSPPLQNERPNIVVIVTESTRADHLPCYGYQRNTTPHICQLAEDSVLFENAYSQGSWTLLSVPQLLTGYPPNSVGRKYGANGRWNHFLNSSILTYPEHMQTVGYTTLATNTSHLIDQNLYTGMNITDRPLSLFSEDSPSFAWVWNQTPHWPYRPPRSYRKWGGTNRTVEWKNARQTLANLPQDLLADLYDADLRYTDEGIGKTLRRLKEKGNYNETLIIYTSDHGELLGKRGLYGHVVNLDRPYRETVHVPLLIKFPDNQYAGKRIEQAVRTVDIFPTLLDYLDKPLNRPVGESFLSLITGSSGTPTYNPPVYSAHSPQQNWTLATENKQYFIKNTSYCSNNSTNSSIEVFRTEKSTITDLNDIETQNNVISALCDIYRSSPGNFVIGPRENIGANVKEKLQELGYLE